MFGGGSGEGVCEQRKQSLPPSRRVPMPQIVTPLFFYSRIGSFRVSQFPRLSTPHPPVASQRCARASAGRLHCTSPPRRTARWRADGSIGTVAMRHHHQHRGLKSSSGDELKHWATGRRHRAAARGRGNVVSRRTVAGSRGATERGVRGSATVGLTSAFLRARLGRRGAPVCKRTAARAR